MDPYDKESWELTGAKMVVVDGEKIKEDTYYRCIEGEIVEVTEDGIIQRVVHFVRKDVPLFSILSKNPPQK